MKSVQANTKMREGFAATNRPGQPATPVWMANKASFASQFERLLAEGPRTAAALLEILGPPPRLAQPAPSGGEPSIQTQGETDRSPVSAAGWFGLVRASGYNALMVNRMKRVPDYLTLSRGVIALAILSLGFIEQSGMIAQSALPTVLLLTMLGWTTDIFDGRLARRINKPPTWVGEREFAFDMAMVFSGLCYLVLSGYIPFVPAIIYVMVAAAFIAYFRSKMITMSFATPVVALPLIVAYFQAPQALVWFIVWIAAALLFDGRRFLGVVREFIYNARHLSDR